MEDPFQIHVVCALKVGSRLRYYEVAPHLGAPTHLQQQRHGQDATHLRTATSTTHLMQTIDQRMLSEKKN